MSIDPASFRKFRSSIAYFETQAARESSTYVLGPEVEGEALAQVEGDEVAGWRLDSLQESLFAGGSEAEDVAMRSDGGEVRVLGRGVERHCYAAED